MRKGIILYKKVFDKDKLSDWAKKVKRRDGYRCMACGYKGYLHSHHIAPKSKYPQHVYETWNGITLCKRCHTGRTGVHGRSKPRNKTVLMLRALMKNPIVKNIKLFKPSRKYTKVKKRKSIKKFRRFKKR